uniref:Transmembrane protein n=1 Tax=Pithovirus LCPAC406 TaxID=2506599 RepID=A0A481ZEU0_9VIRU|nr:MAG: uncharacterized protein LCPAC406_00360 [Pithovirus LCPAC406]
MHYESGGFTFSYVLYVIAIILFIIAVIFAIWFFSLDNQDDKHHHQDREQRKDAIDKARISELFFLSAIAVVLIAIYAGASTGARYAMKHSLLGAGKM